VAQELGGLIVGRVDGAAAVDDEAGARRAGFAALLDVEVGVEAGEIVALGRVVSVERDLWREVLGMRGGTTSGFAVRAKLDGELRAWLGGAATPVTPTTAVARRWSFRPLAAPVELGSSLLALAAADLDADRRAELIALTVDEVLVLRVEAGAATVNRARAARRSGAAAAAPRPGGRAGRRRPDRSPVERARGRRQLRLAERRPGARRRGGLRVPDLRRHGVAAARGADPGWRALAARALPRRRLCRRRGGRRRARRQPAHRPRRDGRGDGRRRGHRLRNGRPRR
jgi:hypothetical protein